MRNLLLLPEFSNVAVSSRATCEVTRGLAYHDITFVPTTGGVAMTVAQMKSMIDTVVIKLNGEPVQEWTPTDLDIANGTNGAQWAAAAGYLTLYFSEPWRRTMPGEESGAWGTDGLKSFTIEVKFNATAANPGITGYANVDEWNRPINAYPIRFIRRDTGKAVVAGTTQYQGLLKKVGLFYSRLHFLSALITNVKVQVNGVVKFDNVPRAVLSEKMSKRGLAMQANTYTLAFDATSQQLTDQLASFIPSSPPKEVQDLRIEYTGSGAGTVDVVSEQYEFFKL